MPDSGRTISEVRALLQRCRDDIAKIQRMIPDGTYLVRGAGDQVRQAAANLKAEVKAHYKRPARSRHGKSEIERTVFDPCMHRTFVALQSLHVGTTPGPGWRASLFDADSELSYWMEHLK